MLVNPEQLAKHIGTLTLQVMSLEAQLMQERQKHQEELTVMQKKLDALTTKTKSK